MIESNIKPCWWGPTVWQTIFYLAAIYPDNPTQEHIEHIIYLFKSLKIFLPCSGCRESYNHHLEDKDTNINNRDNFTSKNNFLKFIYLLKKKVTNNLNLEYYTDFNYFKKKLSHMIVNNNYKFDGKICLMIEAPFIHKDLEKKAFIYLNTYTTYNIEHTKKILDLAKKFNDNPIFDYKNLTFKFLYKRHKKCRKIITKINHKISEGDYDVVESFIKYDAKYHHLLLFLGCTILSKDNLNNIFSATLKKK